MASGLGFGTMRTLVPSLSLQLLSVVLLSLVLLPTVMPVKFVERSGGPNCADLSGGMFLYLCCCFFFAAVLINF